MINIYQTQTILAAIELMKKKNTFLRDRYFPTSENDIFVTEDVLVEYKDEKQSKIAPCVAPMRGGIPVGREGYKTERLAPANVAPERPLTIDDLNKKQFGETVFSQRTPAQREAAILRQDITDLNEMIDGREEYMAAQTLFRNGYSMRHYADQYGGDKYEEFQIKFYDEENNPAIYAPAAAWSKTNENLPADLYHMARILKRRGLRATDLIFGWEVSQTMLHNDYIYKLLDNRRLDLLSISPKEMPDGVVSYGKINCNGVMIELLCYEEEYVDEKGVTTTFIPANEICMTSPGVGRTLYGAVTQMEQADGQFHTYAAKRVPHVIADAKNSVRTLTQKSKPLTIPNFKNSSISSKVLF